MKIKYKIIKLYGFLIIGLVFSLLGVSNLFYNDDIWWTDYVQLLFGLLYIGYFLYALWGQYLTIHNNTIGKLNSLGIPIKMNLSDVIRIKKINEDYTLITEDKEFKIKTDWIEKSSLLKLNKVLQQLDLPVDKTPFHNN
ncbi:hypothetical protein [Nonlabens sp.]|uniref:hypothetical protein n=1 Tax=Nonlabens sp. TaxID=1888209 RepID=UPI003266C7DE